MSWDSSSIDVVCAVPGGEDNYEIGYDQAYARNDNHY